MRSKSDPLDVDFSAYKDQSRSQSPMPTAGKWELNVKNRSQNRNDFFVIHHNQQQRS